MAKKYKRNYLDTVTLKVDFERIEDSKKFSNFLKKLDDIFPYKEESKSLQQTLSVDIEKIR